jgi:hypothetical protein
MNLALFGDVKTEAIPYLGAEESAQTFISLFGDIKLTVPYGTRVIVNGISLFGDTEVRATEVDGPILRINFFSLFGDLKVVEKPATSLSTGRLPQATETFPY